MISDGCSCSCVYFLAAPVMCGVKTRQVFCPLPSTNDSKAIARSSPPKDNVLGTFMTLKKEVDLHLHVSSWKKDVQLRALPFREIVEGYE